MNQCECIKETLFLFACFQAFCCVLVGANDSEVDGVLRSAGKMEVEHIDSSLSASLVMSVGSNWGVSRGQEKWDLIRKLSISLDMMAEGTITSRTSVFCVFLE